MKNWPVSAEILTGPSGQGQLSEYINNVMLLTYRPFQRMPSAKSKKLA